MYFQIQSGPIKGKKEKTTTSKQTYEIGRRNLSCGPLCKISSNDYNYGTREDMKKTVIANLSRF